MPKLYSVSFCALWSLAMLLCFADTIKANRAMIETWYTPKEVDRLFREHFSPSDIKGPFKVWRSSSGDQVVFSDTASRAFVQCDARGPVQVGHAPGYPFWPITPHKASAPISAWVEGSSIVYNQGIDRYDLSLGINNRVRAWSDRYLAIGPIRNNEMDIGDVYYTDLYEVGAHIRSIGRLDIGGIVTLVEDAESDRLYLFGSSLEADSNTMRSSVKMIEITVENHQAHIERTVPILAGSKNELIRVLDYAPSDGVCLVEIKRDFPFRSHICRYNIESGVLQLVKKSYGGWLLYLSPHISCGR